MSQFILLLLALGLGLWSIQTLRTVLVAAPARKASRAGYFAQSAGLLSDLRRQIQPTGFARMAGRYRGLAFDLQAVPDTLTFRKLPALWVMVTVTEPQALTSETHIMARATGQEMFSTYGQMPFEVTLPPDFPPHCTMRSSDPAALPVPAVMHALATLFTDPRVKEAVLSPKGLRLVVLAEEAERNNYLIFRDAELGRQPLPSPRLQTLLESLADLHFTQCPIGTAA
ncbi:MAG: hypothetical protein ACOH2H_11710 [Cypionkella sp.]